uniref:Uncharacterized protein n=1 Tax=Accipiter nisus TaxID=211598 RepID=A0A8B9N5W3_9AVES
MRAHTPAPGQAAVRDAPAVHETLLPHQLHGPGPVRRGAEAVQRYPPGKMTAGDGPMTRMLRGPAGTAWVSPGARSRLQRNGTVSEAALRYLWFHVSSQAVLRIREVLPERHPSWKYTQELCQLFDALGKEYSKYRQVAPRDPPPPPPRARQPGRKLARSLAPSSQGCCGQARSVQAPGACAHRHACC